MKMKDRIEMLEKQLSEANGVISYYANTHNYSMYPYSKLPLFDSARMVPIEDIEVIKPFINEPAKSFGGKLAREYQAKYQNNNQEMAG
jgi:hypothetical protein